jgi:hypothetical protein
MIFAQKRLKQNLESSQISWKDDFKVHRFLLNHPNLAAKPVSWQYNRTFGKSPKPPQTTELQALFSPLTVDRERWLPKVSRFKVESPILGG